MAHLVDALATPGRPTARPGALSPNLPILVGAAAMLSLSMGLRQCFGLIMPPLTRDLAVTVSDFTLAMAVQNSPPWRSVFCPPRSSPAGSIVPHSRGPPRITRGPDRPRRRSAPRCARLRSS